MVSSHCDFKTSLKYCILSKEISDSCLDFSACYREVDNAKFNKIRHMVSSHCDFKTSLKYCILSKEISDSCLDFLACYREVDNANLNKIRHIGSSYHFEISLKYYIL